jgi:hypothetical protein
LVYLAHISGERSVAPIGGSAAERPVHLTLLLRLRDTATILRTPLGEPVLPLPAAVVNYGSIEAYDLYNDLITFSNVDNPTFTNYLLQMQIVPTYVKAHYSLTDRLFQVMEVRLAHRIQRTQSYREFLLLKSFSRIINAYLLM